MLEILDQLEAETPEDTSLSPKVRACLAAGNMLFRFGC